MFGGAYGDARMPNWPHRHRTPLPGIATTGLRRDKEGNVVGQATFLPPFLLCYLSVRTVRLHSPFVSGSIRISGSLAYMVNWLPDVSEVDRPGSSSASAAGLLMAKTGGVARSGIGCWVAVAMGRPYHSRAISILQRIVRATKTATWSHPSALFSIIGTKYWYY